MPVSNMDWDKIKAVNNAAKDLRRGEAKEIDCPKCNGKMRVSKSGYNGHVWGICQCGANLMQ